MNEPTLIKCEHCYAEGKMIYLGSLSSQGNFLIRNTHSRHQQASFTCIMSDNFTLMHDCGFTIQVKAGIIITEPSPLING